MPYIVKCLKKLHSIILEIRIELDTENFSGYLCATMISGQRSTSLEELRNSAKRRLFGRSTVHSPEGQDPHLPPDGTTGTYHSLPLGGLHGSLSTLGVARSTSSSPSNRFHRKDPTTSRPISRPDASMRYSVYDPLRPPSECSF